MIRLAVPEDFTSIMSIYAYARSFMQETGNPNQWGNHFPPEELIHNRIPVSYTHLELGEVNLAVNLAGFHQLVVCAVSFERTISKNEDLVCLTDAGDSLGYEEGCRVSFEIVDGFAEFCIRCKVKRTRAVVQNQDFRFFYQRTRNRKTLFLSAGEVLSVLLQHKIELILFAFYDFFRLGCGERLSLIHILPRTPGFSKLGVLCWIYKMSCRTLVRQPLFPVLYI